MTPVIFNPGILGQQALFQFCDTMIEFEGALSNYNNNNAATIKTIPSSYRDQSAILINNLTASANVASLVHPMAQFGIDAVYLDYGFCTYHGQQTGCYNSASLGNLKALAAAVQVG